MLFLRALLGQIIFWVSWPFLYLYLRGSQRTRVVIEADGCLLMLRGWHDGSHWSLPGGGIHKNELAGASAVREVKEETNIDLQEKDLVDIGTDKYQERGVTFNLQRYGCVLPIKPPTKKQHLEVISLKWINKSEITQNMVDKATWRHLQAWLQHR